MGSVKQHKMKENFRDKKEIVKVDSFFMSARLSDEAVVKYVSYADKHHTHIYTNVSVLRLLLSGGILNYIQQFIPIHPMSYYLGTSGKL